jgi:prefoldin subunit 5
MNEQQLQQIIDALQELIQKVTIISSQLDYIAQQITTSKPA